jgi:hypothetical protein
LPTDAIIRIDHRDYYPTNACLDDGFRAGWFSVRVDAGFEVDVHGSVTSLFTGYGQRFFLGMGLP